MVGQQMDKKNIFQAPVSVIIPCYRCTDTIDRTVTSVVNQTVKPVEVILVDDGSPDETPAALKRLQQEHGEDWINVIALGKNSGVSVARNVGWEAATGEYVAFLDADDAWHSDKIAVQYDWMKAHPTVMLSGHPVVVKPKELNTEMPPAEIRAQSISKYRLLFSNVFALSSLMVKRNCPIRFDPTLRYSQDYYFSLKLILQENQAVLLNYPIGYRFNAPYGESGLTQKLKALEMDELAIYRKIWKAKYIPVILYFILCLWSIARYIKRLCVFSFQNLVRASSKPKFTSTPPMIREL
jgi:glycosyltransferase involved in cell wall biosynthesis